MGTRMPKRSASRPISTPPTAKPTVVSVYGSEASARATPNSACTAGSATTTDQMPTPPIVLSSIPAASRNQAYGDSTPSARSGLTWFVCCTETRDLSGETRRLARRRRIGIAAALLDGFDTAERGDAIFLIGESASSHGSRIADRPQPPLTFGQHCLATPLEREVLRLQRIGFEIEKLRPVTFIMHV